MLSQENCEEILSYAKLQSKLYNKISQTIYFNENFNKEPCYIFKVNKDILNNLNEQGDSRITTFSIKGNNDEAAVLCTQNKSYEIRESETSNTLLVLPDIDLDLSDKCENDSFVTKKISISSTCNKVFEVTLRKAKIGEVYKILQNSILYHHIEEESTNMIFYNFQTLLNQVVMSEVELKNIIKELKVYKLNGALRILYIDYVCDIIMKILECSFENDFSIKNLSQKNVHNLLGSLFPVEILDQTLQFYFEIVSNVVDDTFWQINEKEISRCIAEQLLNDCNKLNLQDFLEQWNKKLPDEILGDISNLHGMIIINDNNKIPKIKLLKSITLPSDPEHRFQELFLQKSIWKQEELEGFLSDIVPPDSSVSQLIMRYCRCNNSSKIKTFSKR